MLAERHLGWLYRTAVGLVFAAYFLGCFHTVANFWQWGHAGFNGAGFFQAARNSVRHGIAVQTPYYTGLSEPGPGEYYTDHPMMIHFHLIAGHRLFGDGEWVGRSVTAAYSFLSLVMLFVILRRLAGRAAALIGIGLYAATPLHLIFATMIDHEQGCIFWLLVCIDATLRYLERNRLRHLISGMVAISLAVQFDWPAYYLAFFLMLFVLLRGAIRRPGWLRWRPEYSWAAIFSAVVLANFVGFFAWIAHVRGGLGPMIHSFFWRSASQGGYLGVLLEREADLHGLLLYGLGAAWLVSAAVRLLRRRLERLDVLPALFFATQLVHSSVFQQAGKIHCYWTYYLGPAFAVAGALEIARLLRHLGALGARLSDRPRLALAGRIVVLLALGTAACLQFRFAYLQLGWGFRSGTAAYVHHYDDQFAENTWARDLGNLFGREATRYRAHGSIFRRRLEFNYYLDAPIAHQAGLSIRSRPGRGDGRELVLLDLNGLQSAAEQRSARELAGRHPTWIWDRRFLAVDVSRDAQSPPQAFVSRQREAPLWWRWLVNPDRPPVDWVPDPAPGAVAALLAYAIEVKPSRMVGGAGGGRLDWRCSPGQVLVRLHGQQVPTGATPLLESLRPECRSVLPEGLSYPQPERLALSPLLGPWLGHITTAPIEQLACEPGRLPVGLHGRSAALVDAVGLLCAPGRAVRGEDGGWQLELGPRAASGLIGGSGGRPFELACPDGQVLVGLQTRTVHHFRAIGILCAALDEHSLPSPETVYRED